ncbi:hypothetical protein GOP47_0002723 [Adiantum capillus-veneris]|uniref:Uncharacterized protein n=1 Tax=Adiantum capillus-veneris TaxID=13818 RepID=A0A9D4VAL8_ADICA|nr:hypothetical protein GOP47_0002723 [Adiantum capillus-veneris]
MLLRFGTLGNYGKFLFGRVQSFGLPDWRIEAGLQESLCGTQRMHQNLLWKPMNRWRTLFKQYHRMVGRGHDHVQPPGLMFPDIRVLDVQDATSEQVTRARRVNLLQHLLDQRLANEEDQHGSPESTGVSFSQRALQYLLRLSSPARNNLGLEGQSNEGSSMEQRRIVRRSYARLTVAEATSETDLVGLWMGVYGPHGAEIIHVTRRDEEGIFGTKVLGDPNVPCGEVSFRANTYFETCEVPVELQQIVDLQMRSSSEPFHIVKMYEGYGRIAGHNFRNPLWVPGHLLLQGSCFGAPTFFPPLAKR